MEYELAQWPKYYPDLSVEVFAPCFYYKREVKPDAFSEKIRASKHDDLSDFFLEQIQDLFVSIPADLIVVVPSSQIGHFSPTMISLAKKLSSLNKVPDENIVERIKKGSKLTYTHGSAERYAAIKDSFKVTKRLHAERVTLLDDTRTTGMTLLECAKELKAAGAAEVRAICLGINKSGLP